MLRAQPCAPSFVDGMCELLAESLSDTDKEVSHQNMFSALLHIVTNYHKGDTLESCLTEEELGRVGLCCTVSEPSDDQ